jgi:hypothetical protein
MEIIPIEFFGVHVDVPFPAPVGIQTAKLERFGAKICDPKEGLSIRPDQIRLKKWDDLFGYELAATFFGDNGQLTLASDRAKLFVRNARTQGDWNVIMQTLTRFYNLMEFEPNSATVLSCHVHAKFPSSDEREQWLNQFSHNALCSRAAALGYVKIFDWDKDIRVLIEASNVVQDGIFVAWDTQFDNNEDDWEAFLGSLLTMMENAANMFELGFEPLKERV